MRIDEIPAGPKLDILVAKMMGQEDFGHIGFFWQEGVTEDGEDGWNGFYCPHCGEAEADGGPCVKPYSTNRRFIWEIVDWMSSLGYAFVLRLDWHGPMVAGKGYATAGFSGDHHVSANTEVLAVCYAALAVRAEVDEGLAQAIEERVR